VPQAFKDATLSTLPDKQAVSGLVQFEFNYDKCVLTMLHICLAAGQWTDAVLSCEPCWTTHGVREMG
jgi:hypothetical protein